MEREKIYNALFKCNSKNEQKYSNFSKLNHIGKRIVYIVINLVIGGSQVKNTVKWLREYWFSESFEYFVFAIHKKIQPNRKSKKVKDEYESNLIKSFFQNGNASSLIDIK